MVLSVDPSGLVRFAAANATAGAKIMAAGTADSAEMLGAAAAAIGPIGVGYLAAYAPAQANNLAATQLVGAVHAAIGAATEASNTSFVVTDNA